MPGKLIPGEKRTMAYKKEGPFKMKGSPYKNEKKKTKTTTTKTTEPHGMYGVKNDQGNMVVNKVGNWVPVSSKQGRQAVTDTKAKE